MTIVFWLCCHTINIYYFSLCKLRSDRAMRTLKVVMKKVQQPVRCVDLPDPKLRVSPNLPHYPGCWMLNQLLPKLKGKIFYNSLKLKRRRFVLYISIVVNWNIVFIFDIHHRVKLSMRRLLKSWYWLLKRNHCEIGKCALSFPNKQINLWKVKLIFINHCRYISIIYVLIIPVHYSN